MQYQYHRKKSIVAAIDYLQLVLRSLKAEEQEQE